MAKVTIGIDVSPLYNQNNLRGIGYFTKNLVAALQKQKSDFEIKLIENCKPKIENYDLIHYPFFDPFQLTLNPPKHTPFITTIYDLIPLQYPRRYPVGIKGRLRWLLQKHQVKKSRLIITSSHHSKHIIKDILGYPEDQIYVTYGAATADFKPIKDKKFLNSIKNKYQLPSKFVLYVGDINWNKNVPTLVKACRQLKYPLVIVGSSATQKNVPHHPWTQDLLWLQQQKSPICLGFVPDADLPAIYNLATLYCQPSFAEGFGLPLVQAIQSGTPAVYSQDSCLPEIMDYSGLMFNPSSISSLKLALKKFWSNPALRLTYINKGLNRASHFNWQQTAQQTLAVYQVALAHEN